MSSRPSGSYATIAGRRYSGGAVVPKICGAADTLALVVKDQQDAPLILQRDFVEAVEAATSADAKYGPSGRSKVVPEAQA